MTCDRRSMIILFRGNQLELPPEGVGCPFCIQNRAMGEAMHRIYKIAEKESRKHKEPSDGTTEV